MSPLRARESIHLGLVQFHFTMHGLTSWSLHLWPLTT